MYKTLYRKWRPKTFDDVAGQEHVTDILKNEVKNSTISHAYLFTGPRGTGKTSCAKILAKAVNCKSPINGNPCCKCEICKSIDNQSCIDVIEIDAASNNSVEDIRKMREEIVFTPSICKYKVYIVDEVHMLSIGAFNAFLKTLEEPPEHIIFILATTELHKLPLTITSRCQKFKFYRLSDNIISSRIKHICENEKIKITNEAISTISNCSDGALRDALSMLEKCVGYVKKDEFLNDESIRKILGMSDFESVNKLIFDIFDGNYKNAIETIEKIYMQSGNMVKLCEEITNIFRNLMLSKINSEKFEINNKILGEKINIDKIIDCIDLLQESRKNMNIYKDKKLEMEIVCIKISNIILKTDTKNKAEINNTKEVIKDSLQNSNSNQVTVTDENYWEIILNEMKKNISLKSLYISLKDSKAHKNENYILIESKSPMAFQFLKKSEFRLAVKELIFKVLGQHYNIGPYNKPKSEENENNALDLLIKNAKSSNIEVIINQEENKNES